MSRPLFVGQAPGRSWTSESIPLAGEISRRLGILVGLTSTDFRDRIDAVNVLDRFPGKAGKGDAFPREEARVAANALRQTMTPIYDRVILLGHLVVRAFGALRLNEPGIWILGAEEIFGPFVRQDQLAAMLPHPSGINRWYNSDENRKLAGCLISSALVRHACR